MTTTPTPGQPRQSWILQLAALVLYTTFVAAIAYVMGYDAGAASGGTIVHSYTVPHEQR